MYPPHTTWTRESFWNSMKYATLWIYEALRKLRNWIMSAPTNSELWSEEVKLKTFNSHTDSSAPVENSVTCSGCLHLRFKNMFWEIPKTFPSSSLMQTDPFILERLFQQHLLLSTHRWSNRRVKDIIIQNVFYALILSDSTCGGEGYITVFSSIVHNSTSSPLKQDWISIEYIDRIFSFCQRVHSIIF